MVASRVAGFPLHFDNDVFSGSLAQLVEHRAFNPMVIGSNPIRPTHQAVLFCPYSSGLIDRIDTFVRQEDATAEFLLGA